jgi:hypothetical protein
MPERLHDPIVGLRHSHQLRRQFSEPVLMITVCFLREVPGKFMARA